MFIKERVVVSAINFFEGGPLSVLNDCLLYLNNSQYICEGVEFIALVHNVEIFDLDKFNNIKFIAFPKSRKSYVFRLYYEYIYFKRFAKKEKITFWLSLHDISPNLAGVHQAVYCHNASPFNSINYRDIYIQPTQFFFRLFYKFLYKINIKKNQYVVVQQLWIKNKFLKMFDLMPEKVIVAPPQITRISDKYFKVKKNENKLEKVFFFPTFPRPFKNIEVICKAVELLINKQENFKVVITIDGSENKYAQSIVEKYKNIKNIEFIGLIKRDEVYEYYSNIDCLIFPSKLETWGLPISEFKQFEKPIFVANLPYAQETVGDYKYVNFFNPDDAFQLSRLMIDFMNDATVYENTISVKYDKPFANGWDELFYIFFKK